MAYLNDTIVGMLVIAMSILIPGMLNMMMYMQHGPPTPPGWSYTPSSWPQRGIMIVLGFAGLLMSASPIFVAGATVACDRAVSAEARSQATVAPAPAT